MDTVEDLLNNEEDVEEEDLALLLDENVGEPTEGRDDNVELVQRDENDAEASGNADATPVKPKKVRRPQPKLNAETLKGKRGLHTLPKVFEKVRFKGPGHEEHDLVLLMKNYEYWCHRLFPILPFDDCLEKLETLGHKKPVQVKLFFIRFCTFWSTWSKNHYM